MDSVSGLCVIIPVYNHHHKIIDVVKSVIAYDLPCILLDDGSCEECKLCLQSISAEYAKVELVRYDINRGKGAVVCAGLQLALKRGFTHALQIDADGQHSSLDIPLFNKLRLEAPKAVVSGFRPYSDLPKGRRYGRMLTDVWVWINTLSFLVKDSMCGFRLYPLNETVRVIASESVCYRMDFDTDMIVRLYWNGFDVKSISIQVKYEQEIVSHFNMLSDNFRITLMHTRLFFGMLIRIPKLLKRHF